MKTLVLLTLLSAPLARAATVCTINAQDQGDSSSYGRTLFSGEVKDRHAFLIAKGGKFTPDFDFVATRTPRELRRLHKSTYVSVSREDEGSLVISVGRVDVDHHENIYPPLIQVVGAADRLTSVTVPARKISVNCFPGGKPI